MNGPQKKKNYISSKYLPENGENEDPPDLLYCLCRTPYDPHDDRIEGKMFQCEGPCRKWVHPFCFGDTVEQILEYINNDKPYFCSFCKKEGDFCKWDICLSLLSQWPDIVYVCMCSQRANNENQEQHSCSRHCARHHLEFQEERWLSLNTDCCLLRDTDCDKANTRWED